MISAFKNNTRQFVFAPKVCLSTRSLLEFRIYLTQLQVQRPRGSDKLLLVYSVPMLASYHFLFVLNLSYLNICILCVIEFFMKLIIMLLYTIRKNFLSWLNDSVTENKLIFNSSHLIFN